MVNYSTMEARDTQDRISSSWLSDFIQYLFWIDLYTSKQGTKALQYIFSPKHNFVHGYSNNKISLETKCTTR